MSSQSHEFSKDDIDYIVENWGKESPHSMKKKFQCSWYAVCKVATENGLKLPTSNVWSEEEINNLKELSDKYHYTEIASMLGKTENAVYLKAKRLGITLIQDRRKWTSKEEELLAELWGSVSIESIAKKLKRTVFSLKVKAVRMNLGPMLENNDLITVSDMVDMLGISRDRITTTWIKLGLNLKKKRLTKKITYYVITWDDLLTFLENNQNEWDSRKVEEYMLGGEPEWLQEKRKRDIKENPLWYRRWRAEDVQMAESLFKSKKSYEEIATRLDRSVGSVATLLRNMGYSYRLPQFWKGSELKYLEDNYQNMTYQEIAYELDRTVKAVGAKAGEMGYQKKLTISKNKG